MPKELGLIVDSVAKDFRLPHERKDSIKERVLNLRKKTSFESFHALKDISFEVKKGEFFGIVGRNGSGKSTLLKLIGGIYQPTRGKLTVNGTLTPFIELGIGFNPELTGKDNIFLNGAILGLTHKEIVQKYQEIVDFAELENFMDQKLKNYSSGMQVRLAFSIAIQAHNDILLIDEVLAVGDASFQRKCFETFKDIKQSNKTVIFVSHDMNAIREYCDRAILIENGNIIASGNTEKVANEYLKLFNKSVEGEQTGADRWGDFEGTMSDAIIKTAKDIITLKLRFTAHKTIENPIFGVVIKDLDNNHIFDSNTKWSHVKTGTLKKDESCKVEWKIPNIFKTGKYKVTIAAAHEDGISYYEWQDELLTFDVNRRELTSALVFIEHTIHLEKVT